MKKRDLYSTCDRVLGAHLASSGFSVAQPGEYTRLTQDGEDRILVDPIQKDSDFAVLLSYYPLYMKILDDFLAGEDRGFPCGPYLNPRGVRPQPKHWSYKNKESLEASLTTVITALDAVAIPWLKRLRDPVAYATSVDPEATLDAALAFENAGMHKKARKLYLDKLDRLMRMIDEDQTDEYVMREIGREFIFLSNKLNVQHEREDRFRQELDYRREIAPLPAA